MKSFIVFALHKILENYILMDWGVVNKSIHRISPVQRKYPVFRFGRTWKEKDENETYSYYTYFVKTYFMNLFVNIKARSLEKLKFDIFVNLCRKMKHQFNLYLAFVMQYFIDEFLSFTYICVSKKMTPK